MQKKYAIIGMALSFILGAWLFWPTFIGVRIPVNDVVSDLVNIGDDENYSRSSLIKLIIFTLFGTLVGFLLGGKADLFNQNENKIHNGSSAQTILEQLKSAFIAFINFSRKLKPMIFGIVIIAGVFAIYSTGVFDAERRELAKTCTTVLTAGIPAGQVKIYNTDEAFPRETCACFAKMMRKKGETELLIASAVYSDLSRHQKNNKTNVDMAYKLLLSKIATRERRIYIWGRPHVITVRNDTRKASRLAKLEGCKL